MFDKNKPETESVRRAIVTDAVETLDELHRIIESVANDEPITATTSVLVQATAERELRRAGEIVGREQPSMESHGSHKEHMLLVMGRYEKSRMKLRAELENFPNVVS